MDDHNKRSTLGQMRIFHQVSEAPRPALGDDVTARGEDAFSMASGHRAPAWPPTMSPTYLPSNLRQFHPRADDREGRCVVAGKDTRVVNRIYHPGKGTRDPMHSAGKQAAADTRFGLWHSTDTRRIVDGKQGALRQKLKQTVCRSCRKGAHTASFRYGWGAAKKVAPHN